MKELLVDANRENIPKVFGFLQSELEACGCSPKTYRQIKLCVDEIFTNIVSYAYHPSTGPAQIAIDMVQNPVRAIIVFRDWGKPYNPLGREEPDTDADLDERGIGGLGIFLVKHAVDDISYEYRDGQNILTIQKEL